MMWHTHAAMGAASVWLLSPFLPVDPGTAAVLMVFAVIGALVPDLDAVESKIKHVKVCGIQPLVPVAIAVNREFGHRKLLHSPRGWLIWTALIMPLGMELGWLAVAALSLGFISAILRETPAREREFLSSIPNEKTAICCLPSCV